jgi:hypothetical protein
LFISGERIISSTLSNFELEKIEIKSKAPERLQERLEK